MTEIAEALGISPAKSRTWRIGDTVYFYTPRNNDAMTIETLTRQRIINERPIQGNFMIVGRLQYLTVGWAKKNSELLKDRT